MSKKLYPSIPDKPGVYYILNLVNHRIYVGQSSNIRTRLKTHITPLRNNNHHNHTLQNDWNTYGANAFEFGVLVEQRTTRSLDTLEQTFIRVYQSDVPEFGYNLEKALHPERSRKKEIAALAKLWGLDRHRHVHQVINRCIDIVYAAMSERAA